MKTGSRELLKNEAKKDDRKDGVRTLDIGARKLQWVKCVQLQLLIEVGRVVQSKFRGRRR